MKDSELTFTFRWINQSMQHLIEVHEIVGKMLEKANDPNVEEFDEDKRALSQYIDGFCGQQMPEAQLDDKPLFLGMLPSVVRKIAREFLLEIYPINLYTGFANDGFFELICKDPFSFIDDSPPFSLSGTARSGSHTEICLDDHASIQDDVYVGMTLIVTSGPGSHQQAQIASYDGVTQTATFMTPVTREIQKGSTYLIESNLSNKEIFSMDGTLSIPRAVHIFGADNYRADLLTTMSPPFKCITEEESSLRATKEIPNTDQTPYTHSEKKMRRLLNIFDQEFGNCKTQENRSRMQGQLSCAVEQLRLLIQRNKELIARIQTVFPERILEKEGLFIKN